MADTQAFTATPDAAAGNAIAVVSVTNGASQVVDQQIVTIGDKTDGTLHAAVTSSGLAVQTQSLVTVSQNAVWVISGPVTLAAGTASIGALTTGIATIGSVLVATGGATMGQVVLATGAAVIGALTANQSVTIAATANVVLVTGANAIGTVTLSTSTKLKWAASPTSRGTGLTTELNSLGNGSYSAAGTAFDNTSNLDEYGAVDIVLASLNPTAGAFLQLFLAQSLDGTNYEDAPNSTNPGYHMSVATVAVTTGSATKRVMSRWFKIPPGKFKLVLLNQTGVALAASGNTVTLYTSDEQVN